MVEVRLHGALAAEFGMRWDLDIQTPREAVAAIEAGRPGFRAAIRKLDRNGMVFRVRTKAHDYSDDDVGATLGSTTRLDIIPIVRGSSAGIRFVVGAALLVYGGVTQNPYAISIGASLVFGAVTEWLTDIPKREEYSNVESWIFSGPANTVQQGATVPVIYGEVLTGSQVISAGISAADLSPEGSTGPFVSIGGRTDYDFVSDRTGWHTIVASLTMAPSNMQEPYEILWAYTGFPGLTVSMSGQTTSNLKLSVSFELTNSEVPQTTAGSATVTVTGTNISDKTSATVSTSVALAMSMTYDSPGASN